jgi:hypothetical protein
MASSGDNSSFKITLYYKNNLQKLYYILFLAIMVKKSLLGYYKKYLKVNDQEKNALYARSPLLKLLLTEKLVGVWKGKKIYLLSFIIAPLRRVDSPSEL